jgi:hypothetical protein
VSSPDLFSSLGDAHRAELGRQAERYRHNRPAASERATRPMGSGIRRTLVRLRHAMRRQADAPEIAAVTAMAAPPEEHHVRVEAPDCA